MFSRLEAIDDADILATIGRRWDIAVDRLDYAPVGFGSYHWIAHNESNRWFVTVDDLDMRLLSERDDRTSARERLRSALTTARALHSSGLRWIVGPIPTTAGHVIESISDRFVCAIYPFVAGDTSGAVEYRSSRERCAVIERLVELHDCTDAVDSTAPDDD
ncbi:MAG: hypothetical protein AAFY28_04095 [Actinomycetota bacterium]